ncbi:MAG: START domain-containing protein [Desulfosarcinaceae bacterium]|jgi:hypothetical protein
MIRTHRRHASADGVNAHGRRRIGYFSKRWPGLALVSLLAAFSVWASTPPAVASESLPVNLSPEGWTRIAEDGGIVLLVQTPEGQRQPAYRARGVLKASIGQILEVLHDNATAAEWMPDLALQEVLDQPSAFERVTRSVYAVPFPFADRELVLHSRLFLDRSGRDLVADAVSVDHPRAPPVRGRVRARMVCSRTRLHPLGPNRTAIDFLMLVDPRGQIPDFLATFGLRQAPMKFVKALEARARTAGYPVRPDYRAMLWQLRGLDTRPHGGNRWPK